MAKTDTEATPCPTCGQMVQPPPKKRGRPRTVVDYKEQKRIYNQRYYQKISGQKSKGEATNPEGVAVVATPSS